MECYFYSLKKSKTFKRSNIEGFFGRNLILPLDIVLIKILNIQLGLIYMYIYKITVVTLLSFSYPSLE